jgi:hypothetical protein
MESFDLALRLMREHWLPIAKMALILVPVLAAGAVASSWTGGHWAVAIAAVLLAPVLKAPFTLLVGRLLFAEQVAIGGVLVDTARRAPTLIATWGVTIALLASTGLSLFLLAPVVHGGLLYTPEAALLERVEVRRCLRRSGRLAGQHVAAAAAGVASFFALCGWGALVGDAAGEALTDALLQIGTPFGTVWEGQFTPWAFAGVIAVHPVHAVYRLLLYIDARTRTEGWDLQVALRAAGMARR